MGELLIRRREMVKQGGASGRLPTEYQEVEWVGVRNSTTRPTAYIDLDSALPGSATIYAEVKPFSIIGAYDSPLGTFNTSSAITEVYYDGSASRMKIYGGSTSQFRYSIGEEWDNFSFNQINYTMGVRLLTYRNDKYAFNGKLKTARITNSNSVVIHEYVPCYRKADGEIGVYDIIANSFHANSGTGTLVKGNNV